MTEALPEEVWVVEELSSAVTEPASIATCANALVIKVRGARFRTISHLGVAAIREYNTSAVTLAVIKGAAPMVVRHRRGLHAAVRGLEAVEHAICL
jgi:hypothetical protein